MRMQPLVALDLGATKIACAVGLPQEDAPGFHLLGTSLIPYPTLIETWLSDPLLVSGTIERALDATGVSGELQHAVVSVKLPTLQSEHVRVAISLADEPITVRQRDLERLQQRALDQVLGIDREALMVERLGCDGNGFEQVRDPRGLSATRLSGTFHVLTMPVSVRRAVTQVVEAAGLEVGQVRYALPAAVASLSDERLAHQRVLLIDVGGLTTQLGWFVENVLRSVRVLPWGGLTMAHTIAKDLRVTMDQALTWSLEGSGCRRAEVRALLDHHWASFSPALESLLTQQPRPDTVLLAGRGALIDGLAERIEQAVGMPATLCRSPHTNRASDLSYQVGLSTAIGLLEHATRWGGRAVFRPERLFDRLIDRTRTVLTEYF